MMVCRFCLNCSRVLCRDAAVSGRQQHAHVCRTHRLRRRWETGVVCAEPYSQQCHFGQTITLLGQPLLCDGDGPGSCEDKYEVSLLGKRTELPEPEAGGRLATHCCSLERRGGGRQLKYSSVVPAGAHLTVLG